MLNYREIVRRALVAGHADRFLRTSLSEHAIVLMYHGFVDGAVVEARGVQVHVREFEEQLHYLAQHHTLVSLNHWLAACAGQKPLPRNPVVLTIDDGYESTYRLAFPLLQQFKAPANLAVTTGFVDSGRPLWNDRVEYSIQHSQRQAATVSLAGQPIHLDLGSRELRQLAAEHTCEILKRISQAERSDAITALEHQLEASVDAASPIPARYRPLTWEQIREMVGSGLVSLSNHTVDHYILSGCDAEAERLEVTSAHEAIRAQTGHICETFCFPNGQPDDYTARTISLLRECGYRSALTTVIGSNGRDENPFALKRIPVVGGTSLGNFKLAIYGGLHELQRQLLSALHLRAV